MSKQTISLSVSAGSDNFNLTQTVTNDQSRAVDKVLSPAASNVEVDLVLTRAQIKSLMLSCQGGDLTIKTNSSGAPADTVVMASGDLKVWAVDLGIGVDPFATADVTKLFLSSTAGTTFALRAIVTASNG